MITRFRTAESPRPIRVQRWQRLVDEVLLPMRRQYDEGDPFEARLASGSIGPVRVSVVVAPAGECFRSSALIRRSVSDMYQVDVLCDGDVSIEQAGRWVRLWPGDIGLVDPAGPVCYEHSATTHVAVLFPPDDGAAGPSTPSRLTPIRVPGDRGSVAAVSVIARQLPRYLDDCHAAEAIRLGVAVVDLLAVAQCDPAHLRPVCAVISCTGIGIRPDGVPLSPPR
jgi:hypothetical protein